MLFRERLRPVLDEPQRTVADAQDFCDLRSLAASAPPYSLQLTQRPPPQSLFATYLIQKMMGERFRYSFSPLPREQRVWVNTNTFRKLLSREAGGSAPGSYSITRLVVSHCSLVPLWHLAVTTLPGRHCSGVNPKSFRHLFSRLVAPVEWVSSNGEKCRPEPGLRLSFPFKPTFYDPLIAHTEHGGELQCPADSPARIFYNFPHQYTRCGKRVC